MRLSQGLSLNGTLEDYLWSPVLLLFGGVRWRLLSEIEGLVSPARF
jgi:hypothetical protein